MVKFSVAFGVFFAKEGVTFGMVYPILNDPPHNIMARSEKTLFKVGNWKKQ